MPLEFVSDRFLHEFSTFGIGGPILYFAPVTSFEEMREGFLFAREKKLPFLVLGKGSNCLFDDRGFRGVVLLNRIDFCNWKDSVVEVGSGYSFSLLGTQAARKGLSGLEFAAGIPASVGGAIFMNAGANGKETCLSLSKVVYLHADGTLSSYSKEELSFGYRFSCFQKMQGAILSATFSLCPEQPEAREKQIEIIAYRKKTQPLQAKSIGCIFRNPSTTLSAGRVIEECGLKGAKVGMAKVSEMHANFIVNEEKATAEQVLELIQKVQEKVKREKGILLEREIWVISYE